MNQTAVPARPLGKHMPRARRKVLQPSRLHSHCPPSRRGAGGGRGTARKGTAKDTKRDCKECRMLTPETGQHSMPLSYNLHRPRGRPSYIRPPVDPKVRAWRRKNARRVRARFSSDQPSNSPNDTYFGQCLCMQMAPWGIAPKPDSERMLSTACYLQSDSQSTGRN